MFRIRPVAWIFGGAQESKVAAVLVIVGRLYEHNADHASKSLGTEYCQRLAAWPSNVSSYADPISSQVILEWATSLAFLKPVDRSVT